MRVYAPLSRLSRALFIASYPGAKVGSDTKRAGSASQAFRNPQDAHLGHAQLASGSGKQRASKGIRGVMETGAQGAL